MNTNARSAPRAITIATLTCLLLTGCASILIPQAPAPTSGPAEPTPVPEAPSPSATTAPPPTETANPSPTEAADPPPTGTTDPIIGELLADIDTAVSVVNTFWATHWSEHFTGTYVPPTVIGLYDGSDPTTAPECGGEPLGPGNAYYCSVNDSLQWDVGLMYEGYLEGDAWAYLVVAHEWGHAIQERIPSIVMTADELQADCLAGATLFGAAEDQTLFFEEGDLREIAVGLSSLGDDVPWTDSESHGDPFERVEWFNVGRQSGVAACFAEA